MRPNLSLTEQIHSQALEISTRYRRAESELIEILQQVEEHRIFLKMGHSSMFSYVTRELGLSESVAYGLITVARKAREVPELKAQLQSGAMTFSNARRIAAVLSSEDSKNISMTPEESQKIIQDNTEWLRKASMLSNRELEKEIVRVFPKEAVRESASYVNADRILLEIGLSEAEMQKLRRVQDLMSQSEMRHVSLEDTIAALTGKFLDRHDPHEKAKRHEAKKNKEHAIENGKIGNPTDQTTELVTLRVPKKREPIPSQVLHAVNLRDQRKCSHILPDGSSCKQGRWVEIHHKTPVSREGKNTLENLTTLCSSHHKFLHL